MRRPFRPALAAACALLAWPLAHAATAPSDEEDRRNWFDDPFVLATHGIAACPEPEGPRMTAAERDAQAHSRVERGTSCFASGRCRLPNAYLYDREIVPRVVKAIEAAGTFGDTRLWITGQRRWVFVEGCVATAAQATELERLVRGIDDVEQVVPALHVGPLPASPQAAAAAMPYRPHRPASPPSPSNAPPR